MKNKEENDWKKKEGNKLEDTHIDNHGAYLQSWIKVLKNDFNELFKASIEAEKASELLYNRYLELNKSKEKENSLNDKTLDSFEVMLKERENSLPENKISDSWENKVSQDNSLILGK